jgi:hypothetical protein
MNCFKKKQCENCKQWKQLSDYNFNVHQLACKKKLMIQHLVSCLCGKKVSIITILK